MRVRSEAEALRQLSLWFDTLPEPVVVRASLCGDARVDVAIVGAGFSGLWTAYYLSSLLPQLRIGILEQHVAGFGASGRNGGWCTAALSGIEGLLERPERRDSGVLLQRAMFDAVDEVGRVCAAEGIDCHYRKGGSLRVAVTEPQRRELRERGESLQSLFGTEDFRWLEPAECEARVRVRGALGGLWSAHCAAVHPARLARGLAACVERRGVTLWEGTRVLRLEPRAAKTTDGTVRADLVVRATEGYTSALRGERRALLPLHSWMIATEPLPEPLWKEVGLSGGLTFGDARRLVTYGQRTVDGRLAFGGLATYRYGSRIERRFDPADRRFRELERILTELIPALRGVRITHRWGGAMGVPRDWRPRVWLDRERGHAQLGGYVGEGVAASNLLGRSLAEQIADVQSERVSLPFVEPPASRWEPEPLRFLAVRSVLTLVAGADRASARGRASPLRDRLIRAISGR